MSGRNDVLVEFVSILTAARPADTIARSTINPDSSDELFDNTQWPETNNLIVIQGQASNIVGQEKNNGAPQIQDMIVTVHCYLKHNDMTTRDVNLATLLDVIKGLFDAEFTLNEVAISCQMVGEIIKQDISPPYAGGEIEFSILYRRD